MLMRDAPRRARRSGVARNRQVEEGRARRDRCGHRDGVLRGRRGAPLLRPHHHERRPEQDRAWSTRQPLGVAGLIIAANTADRQRGVEGVPGAALRQRRHHEGLRGHAALGVGVRPAGARGGPARRRLISTDARLRRGGRRAARRTSRRRGHQLHGLVRGGPLDRRDDGPPPGRRPASSSAARIRSSSATTPDSGERRDVDDRLGLQQCRPALRRGQPHHRRSTASTRRSRRSSSRPSRS